MPQLRLIDIEALRAKLRAGEHPTADELRAAGGGVMRAQVATAKAVDAQRRAMRFCFSDGSVDRAGDTIDPKGWDLDPFGANPVALWAHCSWDLPIGRAANVAVEGKRLMGDIEFAAPETYEFADTVYRLLQGGFLNAVSVGFIPLEYAFVNDKDRPWGIDFKRQELLEISVCPVPCNANALTEARAAGIDTTPLRGWAEKLLDVGTSSILVPRDLLEATFRAAKTPRAVRQKFLPVRRAGDPPDTVEDDAPPADPAEGGPAPAPIDEPAETGPAGTFAADVTAAIALLSGVQAKAGRVLSKENEESLRKALASHQEGLAHIQSVLDQLGTDDGTVDDQPAGIGDGNGPGDLAGGGPGLGDGRAQREREAGAYAAAYPR